MALLILVLAVAIVSTLPTIASVCVARGFGLGVPAIEFGAWRPKAKVTIGSSAVSITPWLVTSSHTVKDDPNLYLYAESPGKLFSSLHPIVRSMVVVSGQVLLLLVVAAAIGPRAFSSFAAGFGQLLLGAADPTGYAQQLLAALSQGATSAPGVTLSLLLTKLCAFTLLPIPTLPGGNALIQLLRWRQLAYPQWVTGATWLGLLALLAIILSWLFAAIWFLLHSLAF